MTERSAADEEIMRLATASDDDAPESKPEPKGDDEPLELGGDDAPELTDEQNAELAEKEAAKKHNHRSPLKRIDILTARLREAEREAAELRTRVAPQTKADDDPAPDAYAKNEDGSDKYEFGEADPQFIRDFAAHAARTAIKEERAKARESDEANAQKQELVTKIQDGMSNIEKAGTEKYPDFEEKIGEAIEARGGEPLHPMLSIGIAVSPAGADVAYRLATDEGTAERIEGLAKTNPHQAAVEFGKIEGEYLADDSDADLNPADPLDMARMLGRMKARLAGKKADPVERKTSKAPVQEARARGASGQFEAPDDTEDFAAFEKKYMRKSA
jgi:hypothetical protein